MTTFNQDRTHAAQSNFMQDSGGSVVKTFWGMLIWLVALTAVPVAAVEPIPISVSIPPLAFFAEKVGGDRVSVHVLLPPGRSPATYAPTPAQVSRLTRSTLLFRVGVPFEAALLKGIGQSGKNPRIVDTRRGITLRQLDAGGHAHDDHAAAAGHASHTGEGHDPHIWLDPLLVKTQAATMRDALAEVDPDGAEIYRDNCRLFEKALDDLDARIRKILAPVKGRSLLVFHPSFGYFTEAYGLRQVAVETAGKSPKGKELNRLIKTAKRENVRVIFIQPQFDQHAARKIAAAIDGEIVSLDPMSGDYIENLEAMARAAAEALQQ
jgi:zinc transport system substrate-binding protein